MAGRDVCVHLVEWGRDRCTLHGYVCLYVCVALLQSVSYLPSSLFQQFLSVDFIGWWRESETSKLRERWKEREIESARGFAKFMTVDAQIESQKEEHREGKREQQGIIKWEMR